MSPRLSPARVVSISFRSNASPARRRPGFTLVELPAVSRRKRGAFTLVELLVVIGIISVLIGILLPALSGARASARSVASLSNLRQLGIALTSYRNENRGYYPRHSSLSTEVPRTRWADDIYPYMKATEVYLSPQLDADERDRMTVPFAHTVDQTTGAAVPGLTVYWGGYGYNFQYLGNSRGPGGVAAFHANSSRIKAPSQTIAVADTHGSKNGTGAWTTQGQYVVDPPLMSVNLGSRGSRRASAEPGPGNYGYTGGNDGDPAHRSTPAERNKGKVNVLFCDGHGEPLKLKELDDFNGDGQVDNGYWNGQADPNVR
jgi:prepilin-type N-terminal cleavage/methylation domain-containing protein/prepilin-type processing-associated H-X9-DG protein